VRVVDSSALVKYFSREVGWEKAREIVLEGMLTLDLAIKEVVSALWRKVLRGEMGFELALKIVRDLGLNSLYSFRGYRPCLIAGIRSPQALSQIVTSSLNFIHLDFICNQFS